MKQLGLFVSASVRQSPEEIEDCPINTGEWPGPFVSCRHHLFIDQDVQWVGNRARDGLRLHPSLPQSNPDGWSDDDVESAICSMRETCSLRVANEDERTQDEVAEIMGYERTLVAKIEHAATTKARSKIE